MRWDLVVWVTGEAPGLGVRVDRRGVKVRVDRGKGHVDRGKGKGRPGYK